MKFETKSRLTKILLLNFYTCICFVSFLDISFCRSLTIQASDKLIFTNSLDTMKSKVFVSISSSFSSRQYNVIGNVNGRYRIKQKVACGHKSLDSGNSCFLAFSLSFVPRPESCFSCDSEHWEIRLSTPGTLHPHI